MSNPSLTQVDVDFVNRTQLVYQAGILFFTGAFRIHIISLFLKKPAT